MELSLAPCSWLLLAALQAPGFSELEVPSEGGRYVARIAKVEGQERVADALARWHLTMLDTGTGRELWSTMYPHSAEPARYFTAPDGSTFVRLDERFQEDRTVVRMDRFGERTVQRTGRDFELERDDVLRTDAGSEWLTEEGDVAELGWVETLHGPVLMLTLASAARDWRRELDVSMGVLLPPFEFGQVEAYPVFPDGTGPGPELAIPGVHTVQVPPVALATLPLQVRVQGSLPESNWMFYAFSLSHEDERRFVLTPYCRPPAGNARVPQVIERFEATAFVQGLAPGSYELSVAGRSSVAGPFPVEVLPGRTHVRLGVSGGIAGIDDSIEVFHPGVVRERRSHVEASALPRHLWPEERDRFLGLVQALPEDPRSRSTVGAADMLQYRLGWWTGSEWRELTVDDGTLAGPVRALVEFLVRL